MPHSGIKKPLATSDLLELLAKVADEQQEHFVVITLDAAGRLINSKVVFIGTVTATLVHPREIFAQAVADMAVSIVVAHNHPSGDPTLLPEDIKATKQLVAAGRILDIELVDYIIIGNLRFVSLKEHLRWK